MASAGRASWRDRALALRDRLVAEPRFRRWAARFPPTRALARRRAGALFDLCAGFVYSQVLLACVRLKLFDMLREGPLPLADIAARTRLPEEATARLLGAAVSLRLLDRRGGGRFGLGPLGAAMPGNAGLAAMIEHHAMLYADLSDPVALLRGSGEETALSRYWAYARAPFPATLRGDQVADYSVLMAASQEMIAEEVLDAFPEVVRHRCLLDVGGGDGAFLAAAAARAASLQLILFDLPEVAARGEARLAGLGRRATAVGGDFRADPLPSGADLISLIRVLHDHDDAAAMDLLRAAHRALPAGGRLLLAEPMAGTPGAEPMGDAYFGFYLLAMGSGRPRSEAELRGFLARAGFARVTARRTRLPLLVRALVAERDSPCNF